MCVHFERKNERTRYHANYKITNAMIDRLILRRYYYYKRHYLRHICTNPVGFFVSFSLIEDTVRRSGQYCLTVRDSVYIPTE